MGKTIKMLKLIYIPAAAATIVAFGPIEAAVLPLKIPLWCVGFTASGVKAGSLAATIQSSIGNVAAGSVFSMCQSYGTVSVGFSAVAPWGIVAVPAVLILCPGLLDSITPTSVKPVLDSCRDHAKEAVKYSASVTMSMVPTAIHTGLGEKVGDTLSTITDSVENSEAIAWCHGYAKTAVDHSVSVTRKIVSSGIVTGLGEKAGVAWSGVSDSLGNLGVRFGWHQNNDNKSTLTGDDANINIPTDCTELGVSGNKHLIEILKAVNVLALSEDHVATAIKNLSSTDEATGDVTHIGFISPDEIKNIATWMQRYL